MLKPKLLLGLLFSCCFASFLSAEPAIHFERNFGQTDPSVRYLARTAQGTVFFTDDEVILSGGNRRPLRFCLGKGTPSEWQLLEPRGTETSYQIGEDPKLWAERVPSYARLLRRNIYDGIDVSWHGSGSFIEYDFLLQPGADPDLIRLDISGADDIQIDKNGELVIFADGREVRQKRPTVYQFAPDGTRLTVRGAFHLFSKKEVGFQIGPYDHSRSLVIDPVIDFSTYLGGEGEDQVLYSNHGFTAGNTTSIDFPGSSPFRKSASKVFFRTGALTRIVGGSGDDRLTAVVWSEVPSSFLLLGYTTSTDLPTSFGALQKEYAGGASDGFLITWFPGVFPPSTTVSYFGTSGEDRITGATETLFGSCAFTGWTTGRGLPSNSPSLAPGSMDSPQGVDGFVIPCSGSNTSSSAAVSFSSPIYFGGSGDDRPSAVARRSDGYFVVGETNSSDLPNVAPASTARNGDSDAFVVRIAPAAGVATTLLFGGSGSDRAQGLFFGQRGLTIAGTTNSNDLPLKNPSQGAFGGEWDAFVAIFSSDLSESVAATYWGGSAAEEVTAVSNDGGGGWMFAGWTASPDFPTRNAVQQVYGGGPDDGFLVHYDGTGQIHQATFWGGSGSDRILSVAVDSRAAFDAVITGQTTSADLSLETPEQSVMNGPSDGFVTRIRTNLIGVSPVTGTKNLRTSGFLSLPSRTLPGVYTLTSDNPAVVLLSDVPTAPASPSITIKATSFNSYYVDCQVENGATDVTITADGFPSASAHVECVRPTLRASGAGTQLTPLSDPVYVSVSLIAINPNDTNQASLLFPRTDAEAVSVQVQVTDPSVVQPSASTLRITGSGSDLLATPLSAGSADLVFTADIAAPASLHFVINAPRLSVAAPAPIAAGFQTSLNVRIIGRVPSATAVTVRSGDPDRLVISRDIRQAGSEEVSFVNSSFSTERVFLQALKSDGDVPLTISSEGFDDVTVLVRLMEPALSISGSLITAPTLAPGESASMYASFNAQIPNPQSASVRLSLESSDVSVLKVTPPFVDVNTTTYGASFQLQAFAAGTAALTLRSNNGVPSPAGMDPLLVTVASRGTLSLLDLEVGSNLVAQATLKLPAGLPSGAWARISSSDPSRVLVSSSLTNAGAPEISGNATGLTSFYVVGMASEGEAKITATVDGVGEVTASATIVPSGFGWTTEFESSALLLVPHYSYPQFATYALDRATLMPMASQSLRPGLTAALTITSDRPDIAVPSNATPIYPTSTRVTMQEIAAGDAVLTLIAPPGFATPASRQRTTWRVEKTPLRLNWYAGPLGIHMQKESGFYDLPAAAKTKSVTITSTDSSKLVISAEPNMPGSETLTLPATDHFFIQALDSRGTEYLLFSGEGFADSAFPINLTGTGIVLTVRSSTLDERGSVQKDDGAYTTLVSGATSLAVGLTTADANTGRNAEMAFGARLRPGFDPAVTVETTNSDVGVVQPSVVRLDVTDEVFVDFQPLSLGKTEVGAVAPTGFVVPIFSNPIQNGRIPFTVTLPQWRVENPRPLRRNSNEWFRMELQANLPRFDASVPLFIRSADPSRLLVGTAGSDGTDSISLTLPAGTRSPQGGGFYIQALDIIGSAQVIITAPGFEDTYVNVSIMD
jgi:hypothetical protein